MATQNEPQRNDAELIDAELDLARALQRISALRRAALHGSYDATTFDRAVVAYRQAEVRLTQLRRAHMDPVAAGTRAAAGSVLSEARAAANGPTATEPPAPPIERTPRLLFARWLVETGRLSDWGPIGRPEDEAAA